MLVLSWVLADLLDKDGIYDVVEQGLVFCIVNDVLALTTTRGFISLNNSGQVSE
jgi:hypothetical protein